MVLRLLLSPITAPFEGIIWIGEQLLERAEAELDDKENLGKRLLALQLAFDMGDIAEEDFEIQEEELLLQIQALEDEANREENEID
ncbi:MAG TPA: gas vesicle protein GvpG [Candidatus Obscuribacterales bacterium]